MRYFLFKIKEKKCYFQTKESLKNSVIKKNNGRLRVEHARDS